MLLGNAHHVLKSVPEKFAGILFSYAVEFQHLNISYTSRSNVGCNRLFVSIARQTISALPGA